VAADCAKRGFLGMRFCEEEDGPPPFWLLLLSNALLQILLLCAIGMTIAWNARDGQGFDRCSRAIIAADRNSEVHLIDEGVRANRRLPILCLL
jgi:hypothetical protein